MNAIEALAEARATGKWARSIEWRNLGSAICWDPARGWLRVPDSRGGETVPILKAVVDASWEVVDPKEVIEDR